MGWHNAPFTSMDRQSQGKVVRGRQLHCEREGRIVPHVLQILQGQGEAGSLRPILPPVIQCCTWMVHLASVQRLNSATSKFKTRSRVGQGLCCASIVDGRASRNGYGYVDAALDDSGEDNRVDGLVHPRVSRERSHLPWSS